MHCSACGAKSSPGTQYCKLCGASLIESSGPTGLVWIVAFGIAMMMGLPMGGIAVVFERLPELSHKGFPFWFLTVLAVVSLLMVTLATVLLGRMLSPIFKTYLESGTTRKPKKASVDTAPALEIEAPPEAVPSVTETTTRTFEPIDLNRSRG